jgi:hypothetical protein
MSIEQIADRLVSDLSAEGFTIQRYDAYSTNSVYLKLDFGVCNSIRISDHPGKKHLKYMYNVLTCHKGEPKRVSDGFTRYYYKASKHQTDHMIRKIKSVRESKVERFGQQGYASEMRKARIAGAYAKGFWTQAELVHVGYIPAGVEQEHVQLNEGVISW